jgi:hypothetical protein
MTQFIGTYTLTNASGTVLSTGSGTFVITPEPLTPILIGVGLVAIGWYRRSKSRIKS